MITEQYLLSNKKQTKEYHEKMSWGVSKLKNNATKEWNVWLPLGGFCLQYKEDNSL